MSLKKLLTNFIRQHIWRYILGFILLVVASMLALALPKLLGLMTDSLHQSPKGSPELYRYLMTFVGCSIAIFISKFSWRYLIIGNCRNVEIYLRDKLFKHLQTLSVDFFSTHKTGDLIAHAINDVQAIRVVFGGGIVQLLDGLIIGVFSILFMSSTVHPTLTLITLIPVPIAVVVVIYLKKQIREKFSKVQEAFAVISDKVQENISGIRVIKAFSQETEEMKKFSAVSQARVDAQMHLVRMSGLLGPSMQVCFGISFLVFIIFGGQLVIEGKITLGDYVTFNSYILLLIGPVMNVTRIIEIWQKGGASYKRLKEIFQTPPGIEVFGDSEEEFKIRGDICIQNLSFKYPGTMRHTLKNINLHIACNKTLGILGRSGSGKTTLVNLLLRLYPVEDGKILIDNRNINEIPVDLLRDSIGYVPQDSFLFSTTIKGNIEFFKPVYSDDEIENAAKLSGVYENIISFPDGFYTVVGERGTTLSGGQKQRISIARAIVKKATILILDDCLSAVDTETENRILKNFKEMLNNRAGIIISHRVSTVKNADEIIFLDNGRIVERGTHDELMVLQGQYYHLYQTQSVAGNQVKGGVQ